MINRQYIFTVIVFLVLAGVTGGVYQFYFRERLEAYGKNRDEYDRLVTKLKAIDTKFSSTKPAEVVKMWAGAVIPFKDAFAQRTEYFNIKEVYEADPPPEGVILKFYYETESNRLIGQLYQAAAMRNPPCYLPTVVSTYFGAPNMTQLTGASVTKENVISWLQQIRMGCYVTKLILDSNAFQISDIAIWPPRKEGGGSIEMHTAGLSGSFTAQNLFTFLEKLQTSPRYFNVNALKVSNRYLRSAVDPMLDVQMLITQARYVEPGTGGSPGTAPAAPAGAPK